MPIPAHMASDRASETLPVRESPAPAPEKPQNRLQRLTCSGCDNTWTGVTRCHCSGCHRTFAGLTLFDAHRRDIRGQGTCLDPATLDQRYDAEAGTWRGPELTDEQVSRLRGAAVDADGAR